MTKYIKKILFGLFIVVILFTALMIILKYNEEGEKTLPFKLSKIVVISTVNGNSKSGSDTVWDIDINQINDLYISFEAEKKEENETIKSITFKNFSINQAKELGTAKLLAPTGDFGADLYTNSSEDYKEKEITFSGAETDDLKKQQIGNMGGTTSFRFELEKIGNFKSNDETEVSYNGSMLKKIGLSLDDLKADLSFDILITTSENIVYKGSINFQTPVGNIVEEGSSEKIIEDFSNVVFKRVKE